MDDFLKVAGIYKESIVDGPGIRLVVFCQGCRHNCPGCHNPETHPFDGGQLMSTDEILDMIKKNPLLDGITFSGGDPFEQAEKVAILGEKIKKLGLNVITYTGYTYEEIIEKMAINKGWERLLNSTDILVDGPFEVDKKSLLLKFRGSKNQRLIDVANSLEENKIVIAEI